MTIEKLEDWLHSPQLWISAAVVVIAFVASGMLNRASKKYFHLARAEGKRATGAQTWITVLRCLIFVVAALLVLQINGVNMGTLAASFGLATAAVAFAVQDLLKDLIMGASIMSNDFFSVGDVVKYGEIYGVVRSFNIRVTQIYDVNTGNIFSVCNRNITEIERVSDWLDINIPGGYQEKPEKMRAICREIAREIESSIPEVTSCEFLGISAFQDSCIDYRIRVHAPPDKRGAIRRASLGVVQDVYRRRNIGIPYPQMDIHWDSARKQNEHRAKAAEKKANLAAELERRRFQKGEIIFREGDWATEMFDIAGGRVSIYTDYGEPSERLLTTLEPGRYFGEMGVVESMPRSATAVAEEDTEVLVVTGKDLGVWFQDKPDRIIEIMQHLSQRTRELTEDYMEVCRTMAEIQEAEDAGQEKNSGLAEKIRRFAQIWRKDGKV